MSTINYDYHALKDAHGKLSAAIEEFEANAKQAQVAGGELIEGNTAEGIKSTMTALEEKTNAQQKAMQEHLEIVTQALNNARELHIANGGEE